ncbi:TPA: hypothetical protein NV825_002024 [Escherichia coli]|nr:hypothetical protein [Escherichia coli]
MKIIEKIINAFLVSQHKQINVKSVVGIFDDDGKYTGLLFDADVSVDYMLQYECAYSESDFESPFCCYDGLTQIAVTQFHLNTLKERKKGSFCIDHLRFPLLYKEGVITEKDSFYSISECEYNKERLQYLFTQGIYGKEFSTLESELSSFFSFLYTELYESLKETVYLALGILNKISIEKSERLIKSFRHRDWYNSYDVEIYCKGLPEHILEDLIVPDILLLEPSSCKKVIKKAKRYLNGHMKTNSVYIKYQSWLMDIDTSNSPKLMSDREMLCRNDLKNFTSVFFKECLNSGKSEYDLHLEQRKRAQLYDY